MKVGEAEKEITAHYEYITKIVLQKTRRYDLDYDDTLNFILDSLSKNNYKIVLAFKRESSFVTYITVVVNRLIFTYARKQKKLPELPEVVSKTPLDILIDQQVLECKERVLRKLPDLLKEIDDRERLVLKMMYFKNLKISQIERALETTRYEINKMLSSALQFFRKKIKEICKK